MSHYTVAVLCPPEIGTDKDNVQKYLETVLEPFNEQPNDDSPFLEFQDETQDVLTKWDDPATVFGDWNKEKNGHHVKEEYKTIDEFAVGWFGYKKLGDAYGYYSNPNAKWDWWLIGGRWAGSLKLTESGLGTQGDNSWCTSPNDNPQYADIARIMHIDFAGAVEQETKDLIARYNKFVDTYGTTIVTQGGSGTEAFMQGINLAEPNGTEIESLESYLKRHTDVMPFYAILDLNGKWHEPGRMGWFGMGADDEEKQEFGVGWMDKFINPLDPETVLVVVDCHI